MPDFQSVSSDVKPVLIDFYADWCGPCQTMIPIIKEMENLYRDKLQIVKIDIETNQLISKQYSIQSVPTFILLYKNEIVWRAAGIQSRNDLRTQIDKLL
ncbi:MAG: thioredoxin [Brumimicrobium sp.]|nr:thioredoxin [Brumimicrobium sp.]